MKRFVRLLRVLTRSGSMPLGPGPRPLFRPEGASLFPAGLR
jgi:hypothetical protein